MDKAEIRAKAFELVTRVEAQSFRQISLNIAEAALTAAYDQGWNEAVEAAAEAVIHETETLVIRDLRIEAE